MLEPDLQDQLQKDGFLAALEQELKEPLDTLLTAQGAALREPYDSVPNHPDNPLRTVEEDQLGRAAFARYLARRIFAVTPELQSGAYSIHLYGPWGSGKSTLLYFLRAELERDNWLVVWFNAWQNQHIRPPWWSLYERTLQKSKEVLRPWHLLSEYWWRLTTGRMHYLIGITTLAWLVVLAMMWLPAEPTPDKTILDTMSTLADNLGKIIALGLTVWTIIQATSRSLLFSSAKAAQNYAELTSDPMNDAAAHFRKLIKHVNTQGQRRKPTNTGNQSQREQPNQVSEKPEKSDSGQGRVMQVAIFVDDLDRCQSSYVVELLEGIQTVFRAAPVLFVVAADRNWLNACYEEAYEKLKPLVHEPGKPLGTLFLEKAFQFSTSIPGIPQQLRDAYWLQLIKVKAAKDEKSKETAKQKASEMMANAASEAAVTEFVKQSQDRSPGEQQAIREEAVIRLAAPGIQKRIEHNLKPFAPFLAPNPRAMKRLVNTYSVNRALATLAYVDIALDRLALWTILSLRWPVLADYLEDNPEMVIKLISGDEGNLPKETQTPNDKEADDVPKEIQAIIDDDVLSVIKGGPTQVPLDAATVRQCALLRG